MMQQSRVSSSSLSLDANPDMKTAELAGGQDGGRPDQLTGVDPKEIDDWIESRRADLKEGENLTDDDRLYLACAFMIDRKRLAPHVVRDNIAKLYFYPKDVESVDYSPGVGATVTLTDGGSRHVDAFQAFDGKDTNRRRYLVDLATDGNVLADGQIYVGMPGSFAFDARTALWGDCQEAHPGCEYNGPEHRNFVLEKIYAQAVAVRTEAEASLIAPADARKAGMSPEAIVALIVTTVCNISIDLVYKRSCSPSEMTIEDESLIEEIAETYGIRVNLDADNPMALDGACEWIDPPKAKVATPPRPDPDVRASHGEMVLHLNAELERADGWASAPDGYFHFKGPNRNGAGDRTWGTAGLADGLSIAANSPDRGPALAAYKGFLRAWIEVEDWRSMAPDKPGEDATESQIADYEAMVEEHEKRASELEAAMQNAGEGVRLALGGMSVDDTGERPWKEEDLRAAIVGFDAMDNLLSQSGSDVHLVTLGKQATGILAEQWAGFGLPDAQVPVDAASGLVKAWRAWIQALLDESDQAGGLKRSLDGQVGALGGG